jgi:nucleoside-diphosphate-sugar epimerase
MPLKGCAGQVFNVGSGTCYSIQQIADAISNNQTYISKRDGEMDTTFADITKIDEVIGWKPQIDVLDWLK